MLLDLFENIPGTFDQLMVLPFDPQCVEDGFITGSGSRFVIEPTHLLPFYIQ